MKQIQSFKVPEQEKELNDFLATQPPEQVFSKESGVLIIFYDDGTNTPEYIAHDLRELIRANGNETRNTEILMAVDMEDLDIYEKKLAELKATGIPTDITGKEVYDLGKDRTAKIEAYEAKVLHLSESVKHKLESIRVSTFKGEIEKGMLAKLAL